MTDIGDSVLDVRGLVDDVASAVDFYTTHLGFSLRNAPAGNPIELFTPAVAR